MSLTGHQRTYLHRATVGCIMILFFAGFVYIYFDLAVTFSGYNKYTEVDNHSCQCPVDTVKHGSNHNGPSEQKISQTDVQKVQDDDEPDTVVLVWYWPFNIKFDLSCEEFKIKKCHLTVDKSLYHKAHGVLIHNLELSNKTMPKNPRPWFQKWVWFNMESPANTHQIKNHANIFNLTCNYRLDSDIPVPYGHLEPQEPGAKDFQLPTKNKLVCWIVSDWNANYRRVKYYRELRKLVNISSFGRAFKGYLQPDDYIRVVSSCKFYLSFENSLYKDYITEKLYRPLLLGTVPVALGPPRKNYEDHVPAESFIHVDDFPSPKELADRLLYLDQNMTEYMKYFEWKKRYKVVRAQFGRTHACYTCRYLQQHRGYEASFDLQEWFWGNGTQKKCL